jgi:hypothetical protein
MNKLNGFIAILAGASMALVGVASATPAADSNVVSLVTDSATTVSLTALAAIAAVVGFSVSVRLAKRAIPLVFKLIKL